VNNLANQTNILIDTQTQVKTTLLAEVM